MTADLVTEWAMGTLGEWLPGYTDFDDEAGCQFRIQHHAGAIFYVDTADRRGPERWFAVRILVEEIE